MTTKQRITPTYQVMAALLTKKQNKYTLVCSDHVGFFLSGPLSAAD